jgi:hypothetical protein
MALMNLMQCFLQKAINATPRQERVTLLELVNLVLKRLRRRLVTGTKLIRVRRLRILGSQWTMAMRSLMATTMRQQATVMSADNSRIDISDPGTCRGL